MTRFGGFPAGMRFTAIPDPFLGLVVPEISDIGELRTTLALFRAWYRKRGYVRFVTMTELEADGSLTKGLKGDVAGSEGGLRPAIDRVVDRGTFLRMDVATEHGDEALFFLNSPADRGIMAKIQSGRLVLPELTPKPPASVGVEEDRPDVFRLYEDNIGLLTPIVADELHAARKLYSDAWIEDAIKEAARQNKRRWSYVSAILERWGTEGRTDGTYRGDTKKADPDKFIKGKYGHMVQR